MDRTATSSVAARRAWSRKEGAILERNHRELAPTHEATVRFGRPCPAGELTRFQTGFARRLGYHAKSRGVELAVYWVREIDRGNRVHLHLLIRTELQDPGTVLRRIVEKASGGVAGLPHCEPIRSVAAITKYVVKDLIEVRDGRREVLLFRRGCGLRLSGQCGGYFVRGKAELWEECRREWYGGDPNGGRCRTRSVAADRPQPPEVRSSSPDGTTDRKSGSAGAGFPRTRIEPGSCSKDSVSVGRPVWTGVNALRRTNDRRRIRTESRPARFRRRRSWPEARPPPHGCRRWNRTTTSQGVVAPAEL